MTSACFRCGRTAKLRRSHILPEGVYRPVYDNKSRALAMDSEGSRPWPVQQGARQYMFCDCCEGFFNQIETPFLRFWNRPTRFPLELTTLYVAIDDLDYENTKRFLLSVLWRAHVSTLPEFRGVDLGPHADKMRSLLDSAAPVSAETYPVYGYVLRNESGGPNRELVLTPAKSRLDGQWNYLTAFLGVAWMVFVSSHPTSLPRSCLLKNSARLVLPAIDTSKFGPVKQAFAKLRSSDA